MPRHRVMNPALGDEVIEFDKTDEKAVADAMARFDELVNKNKMLAARRRADGELEKIKAFSPDDEEVVFRPQLKGG